MRAGRRRFGRARPTTKRVGARHVSKNNGSGGSGAAAGGDCGRCVGAGGRGGPARIKGSKMSTGAFSAVADDEFWSLAVTRQRNGRCQRALWHSGAAETQTCGEIDFGAKRPLRAPGIHATAVSQTGRYSEFSLKFRGLRGRLFRFTGRLLRKIGTAGADIYEIISQSMGIF